MCHKPQPNGPLRTIKEKVTLSLLFRSSHGEGKGPLSATATILATTAKPATSQPLLTNSGTEYPPETEEDGTERAREEVAPKAGTILFLKSYKA